jgi:hypothetical protein
VPGAKKEPEEIIEQELTQEEATPINTEVMGFEKRVNAETEPSIKIKRPDVAKCPETSAKTSTLNSRQVPSSEKVETGFCCR